MELNFLRPSKISCCRRIHTKKCMKSFFFISDFLVSSVICNNFFLGPPFFFKFLNTQFPYVVHDVVDEVGGGQARQGKDGHVVTYWRPVVKCTLKAWFCNWQNKSIFQCYIIYLLNFTRIGRIELNEYLLLFFSVDPYELR